jgi:hypothetical protein
VPEASEIIALTLILVVHLVGGLMLVWGMLDDESRARWDPRWWRRGDDPGDEPRDPGPLPPPVTRGPLPLPGATPSGVRLRDERTLRDAHPLPPRRPQRVPRPERTPQRR